jgi:SAM-dependent methyltransferase
MAQSPEEIAVARLWDENAERWARQVRAGWDRFRDVFNNPMFMEFVPDLSGLCVLDLGCGEGHNTRLFAKRGARMLGVDISSKLIAAARQSEQESPLGIEYREGTFTDLGTIDSGVFDAAVSTMALMDGPEFPAAAREVHRVLRTGGGFYFSVSHPCFMTRNSRWLGEEGREVGRVVTDYWLDEPYIEQWGFGAAPAEERQPFTIRYFPYRIEDYINGLCGAGFRIARMAKPRPTEAMLKTLPALAPFYRHVPIFLHVAAVK